MGQFISIKNANPWSKEGWLQGVWRSLSHRILPVPDSLTGVTQDEKEQTSTFNAAFNKATVHLAPDTDTCAAAIESLFACGAADAAEMIYKKCRAAFLPNPALYSAVIFGRLSCQNGQGATDAMISMDAAGFTPHQRFLSRCLRLMGPFHQQGLLLIDRLGLQTMQQRLLHVLMEACNTSLDPASSVLEVYHFLRQKEPLVFDLRQVVKRVLTEHCHLRMQGSSNQTS